VKNKFTIKKTAQPPAKIFSIAGASRKNKGSKCEFVGRNNFPTLPQTLTFNLHKQNSYYG